MKLISGRKNNKREKEKGMIRGRSIPFLLFGTSDGSHAVAYFRLLSYASRHAFASWSPQEVFLKPQ